ncbi:hydroxyacylglutathione hydrolase [Mycoavidus sp. HKI]|uniref:hydroxyacylglutathione hydrolase n=1 Tax=Mycoavidus sp. HKI TaxID=2840467 RepID=UPI001CBBFE43|nr:hydroxyacylglutathione hydrolase [Mycoavidus sp. HKI]UAW63953.1 hydroxyacylglutathione hydrolase [Mycoavidus sp. HKI]
MNTSFTARKLLEYVAVPAFQDNYIWLVSDGQAAFVVDPGDATPVIAQLRERGWHLSAILLTHHHYDHVAGVASLLSRWDVPVYGPAQQTIDTVTHPLKHNDTVCLLAPQLEFAVLEIPGHTNDHLAYFIKGAEQTAPRVFCGDTLFASGCGRLFEGTPQQMLASLDALAALPSATRVHCGHEYTLANIRFALACEPNNLDLHTWQRQAHALRAQGKPTVPTTLAHEKRVNPFLRVDQAEIQQRLAVPTSDRLATFIALREWKDHFS